MGSRGCTSSNRMKIFILLGLGASIAAVPTNSSYKESRALFSVVKFPNDACTATNGLIGTCLTSTECTSRSGTSGGNCAAGFGVCCLVYTASCTTLTEVSQNNTYLRNPSYPSAYPTSTSTTTCGYKISKAASTVCQLRPRASAQTRLPQPQLRITQSRLPTPASAAPRPATTCTSTSGLPRTPPAPPSPSRW